MGILDKLSKKWQGIDHPFLIHPQNDLTFSDILDSNEVDLSSVSSGDVVALIGDFTPTSISTLLKLIDLGAIIVPLTDATREEHDYFFEQSLTDVIVENSRVQRREHASRHPLIDKLRKTQNPGLVLFSTGTTGRPKAILHDFELFLRRFDTPRPTLKTINFLLFDHIGGINTLLHTLYNCGIVIAPQERTVASVLQVCARYEAELLPTTPTFLRMMLLSGAIPHDVPDSLKIMTYGTERMDQPTLDELCKLLPNVDFRQTFGMSELGIVRVKSEARNSLYMHIGGEGVQTRVVNNVLHIHSATRMLGYLNAPSPFDKEGWYNTNDVVETKGDMYKIVGRTGEVINVGGVKFMASEVERVALMYPNVSLAKAYARENPITGQHVELRIEPRETSEFDKSEFKSFLKSKLQRHMMPQRITVETIAVGHRFKKS